MKTCLKTYSHISECWDALDSCHKLSEMRKLFETFPRWSGEWTAEVTGEDTVTVTNSYYVKNLEDYESTANDYYEIEIDDCEE